MEIPLARPWFTEEEAQAAYDVVKSRWVIYGPRTMEFERQFADLMGVKHAIAVNSGSTALLVAQAAAGIGPGDEVIVPNMTFVTTATSCMYLGAKPVFADIDLSVYGMASTDIERHINNRTKAIIPVHYAGQTADMSGIMDVANKYNLTVIEDAAEAHLAEYNGRKSGSIGKMGIFSFTPSKPMTTGEGGMITTDDAELAQLARVLRDHAFSDERHFWHKYLGFNYRMTNMQAAVGLAQTEQMESFVEARRANAARYTAALSQIPGIVTPPEAEWVKNVFWMYSILVEDESGMTRDGLRAYLADHGIETRTFFIPMHLQPIYHQAYKGERYPVAEMLCQRGFYLPSASSLTVHEIDYITGMVQRAHRQATSISRPK